MKQRQTKDYDFYLQCHMRKANDVADFVSISCVCNNGEGARAFKKFRYLNSESQFGHGKIFLDTTMSSEILQWIKEKILLDGHLIKIKEMVKDG